MHIVGLFKDANGNKFYKVKNSWGDSGKYNGYFYASEAFVRYKTIDIQINKNALSAEMKKKKTQLTHVHARKAALRKTKKIFSRTLLSLR